MKYADAVERATHDLKSDFGPESIAIRAAVRLAIHAAYAVDPTGPQASDWALFLTAIGAVSDALVLYDPPLIISIDETTLQDTSVVRRDTIKLVKTTAERLHEQSFDTTASTELRWQWEIASVDLQKATVLLAGPM
ncbi:hypothetical protein [Rugosimonospora africana]|uniref:Uncharacterized protein n=1 Tax=Rugosimonospora africana TaxID=556532 RepID=A0A8J3R1C9_9ACTN|nr:hypothetical protein [Rugosimonospora africana]GIH21195.1 hypothetical protein Raf01_93670 [Rugosimonospora africana]